jgi:hypothetical protein
MIDDLSIGWNIGHRFIGSLLRHWIIDERARKWWGIDEGMPWSNDTMMIQRIDDLI